MSIISNLKVYSTQPHPCSYLANKEATTLFIDPQLEVNQALYSRLADMGFRRSGQHIYRPHCQDCNACISVRVPVESFKHKRQHRRIWQKNQDLTVEKIDSIENDEYYQLYAHYINLRHADGDMYPPSFDEYQSFLCNKHQVSHYYRFTKGDEVLAVAATDQMDQGLSAIYTFFNPDYKTRSLGVYAILWQIEEVRRLNQEALYLGYWIKACQKMNYKIDYRPVELLVNDHWLALT